MKTIKDISLKEFIVFSEQGYYDLNLPIAIPSLYITGDNRLGKFFNEESEDIINTQILQYIDQSKTFDFLADSQEDTYTFDDGEEVC